MPSTSEQRNMREVKLFFPVGLQVFDFNNSSRHLAARCQFKDSSRHLVPIQRLFQTFGCPSNGLFAFSPASLPNYLHDVHPAPRILFIFCPALRLCLDFMCFLSSSVQLTFFDQTVAVFNFIWLFLFSLISFSIYNNYFVCWPLTFEKSYKSV